MKTPIYLWLMAWTGFIFAIVSVPLILGRIAPNRYYGIKIPQAYKSEALWYKINKTGGKILAGYGLFMMMAALLVFALSFKIQIAPPIVLVLNFFLILACVVHILIVCTKIT